MEDLEVQMIKCFYCGQEKDETPKEEPRNNWYKLPYIKRNTYTFFSINVCEKCYFSLVEDLSNKIDTKRKQ